LDGSLINHLLFKNSRKPLQRFAAESYPDLVIVSFIAAEIYIHNSITCQVFLIRLTELKKYCGNPPILFAAWLHTASN
jgi:hypothetical protein